MFLFDYEKDEKKLNSIFFSSVQMSYNFSNFGDVLFFDTTYRTNRFKMPLAVISGITNTGNLSLFGKNLLIIKVLL